MATHASASPARSAQAQSLIQKFSSRQATVGVVGLGYVGLPLVRAMHAAGFSVIGYDVDGSKIEKLKRGESYLKHLGDDLVRVLATSKRFTPTNDESMLGGCDAVCVCVLTSAAPSVSPLSCVCVKAGSTGSGRDMGAGSCSSSGAE